MRGARAKEFRRGAIKVANQTIDALRPPITAALQNEHKTRARVEDLETRVDRADSRLGEVEGRLYRNLRGRLRWLLTGK